MSAELTFKVGEKGGVSVSGSGSFPGHVVLRAMAPAPRRCVRVERISRSE
jgi:hypothetical protein